jgi:ferrous iron transport protein B
LLVFFAFAMQCFSTLAVVRRETGGWKWPVFQFSYMLALAYGASWAAYSIATHLLH